MQCRDDKKDYVKRRYKEIYIYMGREIKIAIVTDAKNILEEQASAAVLSL